MTLLHVFLMMSVLQFSVAGGLFLGAASMPLDPTRYVLRMCGMIVGISGGALLGVLFLIALGYGGHLSSFPVMSTPGVPSFVVVGVWVLFELVAVAAFVFHLARFLRSRGPHGGSTLPSDPTAEGSA